MKLATIIINLTKEGHTAVRENVTPAELALLVAEHSVNSGGKPLEIDSKGDFINNSVVLTGETTPPRSTTDEKKRLLQRYAGNKVNAMYPGVTPTMPKDFKEAYQLGLGTTLPAAKMMEVKNT